MKKNSGFTLIEITISIAMLAFISVVVIKLFVAANNVNVESVKIDTATLLVTNELELLATKNAIDELDSGYKLDGNKLVKSQYFNEDFVAANEGIYELQLELTPQKEGLYKVYASFLENDNGELTNKIELSTYQFFKNEKGGENE